MGIIHTVPFLRRRDSYRDLFHERDRVAERPLPACGQGLGPLPGPLTVTALKCLYLVTRSLDPTGSDRTRWTVRWKPALNAFATDFAERWPAAGTY